jgi:predicted Zn-dependent protease
MVLAIVLLVLTGLLYVLARSRSGTSRPAARTPDAPGPSTSARDWARWGNQELGRHRLGAARESFERAKRLDPSLAPARLGLIMVHALRMERSETLAEFAALTELCPLDFDLVLLWTQVRCSAWDPDKVIPRLRAVLDADAGDRKVRLTLGEGLRRLGRSTEAFAVLTPLDEADPEAQAIRARLAIDQDDWATAEAILAHGSLDQPELARLRGQIALMRRDGPAAAAEFRRVLAAWPDDRGGLSGLGQALCLSGQAQAAEPLLKVVQRHDVLLEQVRRAAEMNHRDDPELLRALGAACETLQLLPEARAWYQLALARDPLNSGVQIALHRLGNARAAPRP